MVFPAVLMNFPNSKVCLWGMAHCIILNFVESCGENGWGGDAQSLVGIRSPMSSADCMGLPPFSFSLFAPGPWPGYIFFQNSCFNL